MVAACGSPQQPPQSSADPGRELAGKVTVDGMRAHLDKLAGIATGNSGSRAVGTPGYDASVDYVAGVLRDKGFDVQTPEFTKVIQTDIGDPTLTISGRRFPVTQASLLVTTPAAGVKGITLRPQKPAGCTTADYGTVNAKGAIVIVDSSGCSVVQKHDAAVAEGAIGLLVVSDGAVPGLFPADYYQGLKSPVAIIDKDVDAQLRRTTAPVQLSLDGKAKSVTVRNVLAQTKTGDVHEVVVAGAHLGSAQHSPGMNDDASGVAAVLETAAQLGGSPAVTNAVRFAFWGSDESGLDGSTKYVAGLDKEHLADIAMYLNFDMLASKNAGYFTYDGDQSGQPSPGIPAASVPPGSAGVERTLAGYLNLAGMRPADMPLSRASDYGPFLSAGVPIGGITTGASQVKSPVQARLWGGQAGVPFDPGYRTPRDVIDNVNLDALAITGPAVGFSVGTYAASTDGPNGVKPRG
ncbi:peptidase M28 [Mycolicibacterium sp. P9-64]|uniref:M28 family peptidase n=1 Tax=Mycolicibacterium sp. P9-64 TaxID=2024612 RepID=UPI0011EF77B5|nr:M28 family peptidase [Mycolicibacterium sp. P9-64]KAA0087165.1 peptidase M28 [Mycolicibacterium sp. P9-64]